MYYLIYYHLFFNAYSFGKIQRYVSDFKPLPITHTYEFNSKIIILKIKYKRNGKKKKKTGSN